MELMSQSSKPNDQDLVLGGQTPPPIGSAVLRGLKGLKKRLKSLDLGIQIDALFEAPNYGDAGIELLFEMMYADEAEEIEHFIHQVLWHQGGNKVTPYLLHYDWRQFYSQFYNGGRHFDSSCGSDRVCDDSDLYRPIERSHVIEVRGDDINNLPEIEPLRRLCQSSTAKEIKALECGIVDPRSAQGDSIRQKGFPAVVKALVSAHKTLPSLTALFVGASYNYSRERYINRSEIYLSNFYPLLKAYPNLEILQIRGWLQPKVSLLKPEVEILKVKSQDQTVNSVVQAIKHKKLKTLILEVNKIDNTHLSQILSLQCDSLEYLEILLRGRLNPHVISNKFAPMLSGSAFPKGSMSPLR
jgi:hypothetical protein